MRIKILITISFFLFLSCSTNYLGRYSHTNKFISEGGIRPYFQNDSLRVSMQLYGDYTNDFSNNEITGKEYRFYKRVIKANFPDVKISRKSFVYKSYTTIDPWIHTALFVFPPSEEKHIAFVVDTARLSTLFFYPCAESNYIRLFTLDKKKHGADYVPLLAKESNDLNETFQCDDDFKKVYPQNPFSVCTKSFGDSTNYLLPVIHVNQIENQYYTKSDKEMWLQAAMTFNSFVSNNTTSGQLQSRFYQPIDKKIESTVYDDEAIAYIKEQMKDKQIVMINEQHWQPKHRYLGNSLLKYLYGEGFRYLAVEAIGENQDSLNIRRYPLQKTGFYTKEPQFGNFIRNALQMGFEIVAYDEFTQDRERKQAENIYHKTFGKNPNAKVLVWGGIEHINEEKTDYPKMGYYLKELSGIDPLTIEQTLVDFKAPFLNRHWLAINADSTLNYNQYNIYIYNNIPEAAFQIKPEVNETVVSVPLSQVIKDKITQHGSLLLMVYLKEEFEAHRFDAVPVLNYLLDAETQPVISLPDAEYTFIIRSPSGAILEQSTVSTQNKNLGY
ncbi:hypothetical protein [Flavobacterium sp. UBA6031]|uniref:hypothetical protein n=1 Tax=Flavobacterium sp. UBA6031 TaxID=1946551 RepID=UPI0025B7B25E|nr:hypothetical protein [Flavobacterium sp. UBA6031]